MSEIKKRLSSAFSTLGSWSQEISTSETTYSRIFRSIPEVHLKTPKRIGQEGKGQETQFQNVNSEISKMLEHPNKNWKKNTCW